MSSAPPPSSGQSSNSPPPPSSSPPPPDSSDTAPPPQSSPPPPQSPPPSNSSSSSAPPPNNSSPPPPNQSPPPPPNNNNNGGNNNNNNNNNNNRSPPPPPPPPPPHRPGSGSSSPSLNNNPPPNGSSPTNQNAIIIGVGAGVGLLFFIMIVFIISCATRKKRRPHDHMKYYRDNSHSDYHNSGPGGNWPNNVQPPNNQALRMSSHQASAQASSEMNWPMGPPPPPPMMSSSEMSSAGFSGPYQAAQPPPHPAMAMGFNQSSFTHNDLAVATGGFSQANLLGQGGFGYVHKGVLPNGKDIAVKSLKANSGQGEREFQAEVDIISRVHHRHLVSLVGYCIAGAQRMLVYEFVPNGTLEYHLHGADRPPMDWSKRLKIALGSAKGFAYLHEDCHPKIIHRDIKAANILLDYNFEAKVADFGLAKLSADTDTHVSTRIMGTFGYLAPEYASSGKLTEKSDVYSYGIMLLELITGRRPIDMNSDEDDNLVDWARSILVRVVEGGSYDDLVDPRLEDNYNPHEMLRMVYSAAACVRHSARRRPKMSQIVRALEGDASLDDLTEGIKPGQSAIFGSSSGSDHSGTYSEMKKFRNTGGMSSQEYTSSEYGQTGEFAHGNSQELRSNRNNNARNL